MFKLTKVRLIISIWLTRNGKAFRYIFFKIRQKHANESSDWFFFLNFKLKEFGSRIPPNKLVLTTIYKTCLKLFES